MRTRRNAAAPKAPLKVFAREDVDGVRRSKRDKRKAAEVDDDVSGKEKGEKSDKMARKKARTGADKSGKAAKKAERRARKDELKAMVSGARGREAPPAPPAPGVEPSSDVEAKQKSGGGPSSKSSSKQQGAPSTEAEHRQRHHQRPPSSKQHAKQKSTKVTVKKANDEVKKATAQRRDTGRTYWEHVKIDGEVFERGECAYVISDRTTDFRYDEVEEVCR